MHCFMLAWFCWEFNGNQVLAMGSLSFSPIKARACLLLRLQCLYVMIDQLQTPEEEQDP